MTEYVDVTLATDSGTVKITTPNGELRLNVTEARLLERGLPTAIRSAERGEDDG